MTNSIRIGLLSDLQELSPFGRKLTIGSVDSLYREDRTADGTLRRDIIARKKTFTLEYEMCDEAVVNRLDYLYSLNVPIILEISHLANATQYNVLINPISKTRELAVWGGLWSSVSCVLNEV